MPHAAIRRGSRLYTRSSPPPDPAAAHAHRRMPPPKTMAAIAHSGGRCVPAAQANAASRSPESKSDAHTFDSPAPRPHRAITAHQHPTPHHPTSRIATNAIRDTTPHTPTDHRSAHPSNLQRIPPRVQPIHEHAELPATSHRSAPAALPPSRIPSIAGPTRPYRHPPVPLPHRRTPTMKPRSAPQPHAPCRDRSRLPVVHPLIPPPDPAAAPAYRRIPPPKPWPRSLTAAGGAY